ncbi:MAG: putative endonuclease [Pseudonocardiales bacterium]|jgi:putative endonuclease|nr:putative endonuclease [Pseudonocardiales bacterium]
MHPKDALGRYGERIAARCLADAGLELLDQNWRCPRGEIDIVARDGGVLVICEVKTRSSLAFGAPVEAIGFVKAQRLRSLGLQWLADHPGHWDSVRFDVVSVLKRTTGPAQVRYLRGAF